MGAYSQWDLIHSGTFSTVGPYSQWELIHSGTLLTVFPASVLVISQSFYIGTSANVKTELLVAG